MKTTIISLLCILGIVSGSAGERPATRKKPLAKNQGVLQAELKVPDTVAISAKRFAELAELKKTIALQATLQKKLNYLGKAPDANRDEIEKLRKKVRELWIKAYKTRQSMKQGISVKLILRNMGKSDVILSHGGDMSRYDVVLTGPGAWNLPYSGPMNASLTFGKPLTIKAGSSHTFALNEFKYGERELSRWLICKPGDYVVTVAYNGVIIAHARDIIRGKSICVKAEPVTFKVVKK